MVENACQLPVVGRAGRKGDSRIDGAAEWLIQGICLTNRQPIVQMYRS